MEQKDLTCIRCPFGCLLDVRLESGQVISVKENNCPRGEDYAKTELVNPERVITSTVRVEEGVISMASVKTTAGVPKKMIFEVMNAINKIKVDAPVKIGDLIIENVVGTGVDVVATQNVIDK